MIHHEDYVTLIEEAKQLVERDYPDGPQKEAEILRYEQILFQHID